MRDDAESLLPIVMTETGSDYGDFASDEVEIINHLLGNISPPSPLADSLLLVTDIEDYEEPRGVRLPKVLGVERSAPFWLSQVQFQSQSQILRDSGSSDSMSLRLVQGAFSLTH